MLDVFVPEVGLNGSGVVALDGQREPAGMPQHMGVGLEPEVRLHACTLDHARETCGREGGAALRGEYEGRLGLLFALQPPEPPQLVPEDRVCRRRSPFDPADCHGCLLEVDLVPAEVDRFDWPEAMAIFTIAPIGRM
jgi:hypothetical protein